MIPVYQPYLCGNEKKYVNECLDSTWISSKGEFIKKFENEFANYIGVEYATTVCNGTVALHLALAALDIGHDDEVIVPSFTYIASVNTILQTGGKAVFVDSELTTLNIDVNLIEAKITPKTKAIMAVHLYGLPCNMDKLVALCKKHNLFLIEDCAEAFGSYYKEHHVGTFGDISTFSFFGNKTITTGEGGMVVSNNKTLIEKAFHLKNQGVSLTREYWHDVVAYNYRMTNITAAIGLAQIEQAKTILAKKRAIALRYQQQLQGLALDCHIETEHTIHSYWMCSIMLHDANKRDALRAHLKNQGIETRPFFPASHTLPHCQTSATFKNAEIISSIGVNLPSYPSLTENEIDYIASQIREFLSSP